jgi:hypothetical protein
MSEQKNVTMWTIVGANLVTAAILGAVAFATTIPGRLEAWRLEDCEALQAKAREELKKIYIAEWSFKSDGDAYGDLKKIGYTPDTAVPYDFSMVLTAPDGPYDRPGFIARAIGQGAMQRDEWTLTDDDKLTNKSNACRKE